MDSAMETESGEGPTGTPSAKSTPGTEKFELMLNYLSKVCIVFGCLLFFSVTLGVSLSYRLDPVSVILGYHLCFGVVAVGWAIRSAYHPESKGDQILKAISIPRFPSLRSLKQLRDKVRNGQVEVIGLGATLVFLGIAQTGGALFARIVYIYVDRLCITRLIFGVIYTLSGMTLVLVTRYPLRWVACAAMTLTTVSFVGATVLVASYGEPIYFLRKEEQFYRFGFGLGDAPLPYPNPVPFAMGLAAFVPQQIAVAVAGCAALVTLDWIVGWDCSRGAGDFRTSQKSGIRNKIWGYVGIVAALLAVSVSLGKGCLVILWQIADTYLDSPGITKALAVISVLFGLVLVGLAKLRPSLALRTAVLVLGVAAFGLGIAETVSTVQTAFRSTLSSSPGDQLCVNQVLKSNFDYYCSTRRDYDQTEPEICLPSSKVCDGYLDMLLNSTGSMIQVCTTIYGNPRPAIQDESTCIMDRFSGLVYFTITGLSIQILLHFIVVGTLVKGLLPDYFRIAKRIAVFFFGGNPRSDDENASKISLLNEKKESS